MDNDTPHEWEWRAELGLDELEEPSPPVNRARAVGAERAASPWPVPAIYIEAERGPPKPAAPLTGRPQKRPPPPGFPASTDGDNPERKREGGDRERSATKGLVPKVPTIPNSHLRVGKGEGEGVERERGESPGMESKGSSVRGEGQKGMERNTQKKRGEKRGGHVAEI